MKFGYFTLSDNNYRNNDRSPNQCVSDILEQALYADELGMHSVWIGEHHFSTLGVNSSPEVLLAYIAAKTKHVRLEAEIEIEDHLVEARALDLGLERIRDLRRRADQHRAVGEVLGLHGLVAFHQRLEIAVVRGRGLRIARECG